MTSCAFSSSANVHLNFGNVPINNNCAEQMEKTWEVPLPVENLVHEPCRLKIKSPNFPIWPQGNHFESNISPCPKSTP